MYLVKVGIVAKGDNKGGQKNEQLHVCTSNHVLLRVVVKYLPEYMPEGTST